MPTTTMTAAERDAFLRGDHVGIIAVERAAASPLAVPVWYAVDDSGDVVIWTERDSLKARCIQASGRFTLAVQSETPPYGYVSLGGPVVIRGGVTGEDIRPIVARYLPESEVEQHIAEALTDSAVLIAMRPTHWHTADYGK